MERRTRVMSAGVFTSLFFKVMRAIVEIWYDSSDISFVLDADEKTDRMCAEFF